MRAMCSDALGVQLVFIPEEYGGLGGGAFDSYRVCERMARLDIGLATSVFATFLGSDPILMGGTEEQTQGVAGSDRRRRASSSPTAPPSPRPAATSAR